MLLVWVELFGYTAMGATRWINIPGVIRFQPAELMKILMPATIAWYLARHNLPPNLKHTAWALVLIGMPFVLILKQPDLGTSLLILASGAFVLFVAGLRWRWVIGAAAAAIPVAVFMWLFVMHQYQKQRVLTFLDPESDPLGTGWNIIQSKAAIGSGGVFGKGWLQGTQSHLDFFCRKATPTLSLPCLVKSSAWSASACSCCSICCCWRVAWSSPCRRRACSASCGPAA